MDNQPVDLGLPVFSRQSTLTKFGVMSYDTPQTNLWLERTRLHGMMFGGVSYGILTLLTVQAATALMQRPRYGGKIANNRLVLLFYIFITFALGTIDYAANARYTEMIWIDLRDAPGGPLALIESSLDYSINIMALSTYFIMGWCMQALLLHRCSVIWCRARSVMVPMIAFCIAMLAVSILVIIQASTGAIFFKINTMLLYLCMEEGFTLIYTILVTSRLLVMRSRMRQAVAQYPMAQYNSSTYDTVVLMLIESAMLYSVFCVALIVSVALHSDGVFNLIYLSITNIQGIAQLLIIIRVARGRAITHEWSTRVTAAPTAPTSIVFSRTMSDMTDGANMERMGTPEQDGVPLYSIRSPKATEVRMA
ncbi:uncharacterized protein BJ212DRAFT_1361770 [Suillus subaureus]|uniref:Uncharacterized protein n=1 Tax=Suillus subaureus TaxID=48587 RepID=A0A9P7E9Z5_9AGAM|nr:uncharacterized protein BJ212DRAFT_1361770 [Suillus subaureus]KAG1814729.1 hypothetical protein BJ212DRAFT_1361770 [Suillus subaureus]